MENKVYPTIKNAISLCLLFLGINTGLSILILLLPDISLPSGIVTGLYSIISFGVVLLIGFKKAKRNFNEVFKFNNVSPFLWGAMIIFSIGLVIVMSELDNILNYFLPMPDFFRVIFDELMSGHMLIISLITIGIIPAFTEELLFRGLLLDGLCKNYSERKAIIVTALLFGIIHLNPWQFLTAFIIGLVTAYICIKTKSILLCIYLHLFNNVIYVVALRYNEIILIRGFNTNFVIPVEFQPLWFTLAGVVITTAGATMLLKGIKALHNHTDTIPEMEGNYP